MSAKDKATGKEQRIAIKASSGLSEDEIKQMVKEAEAHAEEDRKFRELVDVRNRADALLHTTDKSLKDLGEIVPPAERGKIESALSDLKTALASDDKDIIEKKAQALEQAFSAVAQQAYAQAQPNEAGAGAGATGGGGAKDDVLDAEFEEVKDKKKGT